MVEWLMQLMSKVKKFQEFLIKFKSFSIIGEKSHLYLKYQTNMKQCKGKCNLTCTSIAHMGERRWMISSQLRFSRTHNSVEVRFSPHNHRRKSAQGSKVCTQRNVIQCHCRTSEMHKGCTKKCTTIRHEMCKCCEK